LDNSSEFLDFAIKVAKKAGQIQMSYFGKISSLDKKSTNIDLLTNADTESEKFIIRKIQETFPEHSILSEERGELYTDSKYLWVIDPLDGTTNFAHNLPIFAVSIGLKKNNETICGVVYNPAADKCFYAKINNGSYLNNSKISVSQSKIINESLLATGFPYNHDSRYDKSFELFKEFYDISRGIRRLGAAALDLCFVAMGRFDGFYEFNLNSWDICAGSLIAKEAGGKITDWNGNKCPSDGNRIVATNGLIHHEMLKILTKQKYKIFY